MNELDKIIGCSLNESLEMQDLFTLITQLYKVGNEYGENNAACKHGIISQTIQTLSMIDPCFIEKYSKYEPIAKDHINVSNNELIVEEVIKNLQKQAKNSYLSKDDIYAFFCREELPELIIKLINKTFMEVGPKYLPYLRKKFIDKEAYFLLLIYIKGKNRNIV